MHANLRWWLPYRFLAGLHFWYPIFFLYFLARLPLVQVLQLEAIYYACVVLLEVPSGWFIRCQSRTSLMATAPFGIVLRTGCV